MKSARLYSSTVYTHRRSASSTSEWDDIRILNATHIWVGFDGYTAYYAWLLWPPKANSLVRDSSSTKRRLLGFYPPTLWDYIRWLLVYMVDGYLWIVSSFPICYWLLQQRYYYSSTTTAAWVIVPWVIAVGQHCSSAPRNPFLSQRLKCETTGRSATAPDLDDKGSPRGAAHRCTHIGRGHNATTHSFLGAIVKVVLAV